MFGDGKVLIGILCLRGYKRTCLDSAHLGIAVVTPYPLVSWTQVATSSKLPQDIYLLVPITLAGKGFFDVHEKKNILP